MDILYSLATPYLLLVSLNEEVAVSEPGTKPRSSLSGSKKWAVAQLTHTSLAHDQLKEFFPSKTPLLFLGDDDEGLTPHTRTSLRPHNFLPSPNYPLPIFLVSAGNMRSALLPDRCVFTKQTCIGFLRCWVGRMISLEAM